MQSDNERKATDDSAAEDIFAVLKPSTPDPQFEVMRAYRADTSELKMNLALGAYRVDGGEPYLFEVVKKAERELASSDLNKEYLYTFGDPELVELVQKFTFGTKSSKIASSQTIAGTGALKIGFDFLATHKPADIYISDPTWANHIPMIEKSGLKYTKYPYYDPETRGLNFKGMIECLNNAPRGSIILLQSCAHNPTGVDPTKDQWREIASVVAKNELVPFFDSTYSGFASGDLENDNFPIRLFYEAGLQMIVAQSFSKTLGLYGERIGSVHFVTKSDDVAARIKTQLMYIQYCNK